MMIVTVYVCDLCHLVTLQGCLANTMRQRDPYSPPDWLDDLYGANYECIIEGRTNNAERKADRDCCREVGGRLSDLRGHVWSLV
jgi:hypothetical protein